MEGKKLFFFGKQKRASKGSSGKKALFLFSQESLSEEASEEKKMWISVIVREGSFFLIGKKEKSCQPAFLLVLVSVVS